MPFHWIKLQLSYLDNPKLGTLPEEIQCRYFKLYMLAGRNNEKGVIKLSDDEIAWKLHISQDELKRTYNLLTSADLFKYNGRGPELPLYTDDQKTQDPTGGERQERHRKNNNTVSNAVTNGIESESELKTESESELKTESDNSKQTKRTDQGDPYPGIPAADWSKFWTTTKTARETQAKAYLLLATSGLGNPKLLEASNILATRTGGKDPITYLMAVLAQVYSNPQIKNPPVVAYKMIMDASVTPDFRDKKRWKKIPPAILDKCQELGIQTRGMSDKLRDLVED
jgi:hypothetical protein